MHFNTLMGGSRRSLCRFDTFFFLDELFPGNVQECPDHYSEFDLGFLFIDFLWEDFVHFCLPEPLKSYAYDTVREKETGLATR